MFPNFAGPFDWYPNLEAYLSKMENSGEPLQVGHGALGVK